MTPAAPTSGQSVQKPGQPGERCAPRQGLKLHHRRQLFEQVGQRLPQGFIVPLEGLDLLRVNAAVGVRLDRYLV